MNSQTTYPPQTAYPPMAWHAGGGHSMRSKDAMDAIRLIRYDDLPENEKAQQPNNGRGKQSAMYLAFEVGKKTVYRSDAMEPEDTRFTRDLAWIQRDFDALIAERDATRKVMDKIADQRDAARAEANALREELAALRAIAQNALDHGSDKELVYALLYQQALEDIASEEQDE